MNTPQELKDVQQAAPSEAETTQSSNENTQKKKGDLATLMEFAGSFRWLTVLGCVLSALSMVASMVPYICIWLVARDLIATAPNWQQATNIASYGWAAFGFAFGGIVLYFAGLTCTHLAAFRTGSNIRKQAMEHLMHTPLGFFDNNASGLLRNRIDGAAEETHSLLAHNLADIAGTIAMFVSMVVLMFVFDWRMGLACLLAAVVSVAAMFSMMGGKNAGIMAEYQAAQDTLSKAGTEYVRGIPVVKVFQQTVYSFKAFKQAIDDYSEKADLYQGKICRIPQSVNLTFTEGAFVFLVPLVLLLAPRALEAGSFTGFVTDFAFYAVFSAIISTALAKVMFAASGMMLANTALNRIRTATEAPIQAVCANPQEPQDNSVVFCNVGFTYEGAETPALEDVSFTVESGETVALVGPSGGGKTTAASLVPRFWDTQVGSVLVGGVDVRNMDPHVLMDQVAFVFQNNHLFKASVLENVRAARPDATREEVEAALSAAQCSDIVAKLPAGLDTPIGTGGTYLSGGEAQRIALARAILKDAPIVVLDEATAFADPENETLIQKAFAQLTQGRTVVMIAHRLSTVVGADKIVVLDAGRVVETGTHEQLTAAGGLYARMWKDYNQAVRWRINSFAEHEADVSTDASSTTRRFDVRNSALQNSSMSQDIEDASVAPIENKEPSFLTRLQRRYALSDQGVKNAKKGTFWTVVVNLVVMGGIGILYLLMMQFMQTLVENASLPAAAPYLVAVLAFIVLSFITHMQQYHNTYSVVYQEVSNMRIGLAEKLRRLPLSFFGKRDLADLTETIMGDVGRMEHVWSHVVGYLYGSYVSTVIIAIVLFVMDWRLALACLWGVPVGFGLLFGTQNISRRNSESMRKAALDVSDGIQETLENVREIRATNQEEHYLQRLYAKIDTHEAEEKRGELVGGMFVNAASVIMRLGVATTILVGASLILSGQIDFMLLFMFLLVITRIYAPFDQVLALISEVLVSEVSANRLQEIYDIPVATGETTFKPDGHDIEFKNVGFGYGGEAVLTDVSFTAREGEVTALVGPSGSGKSTCARLAARLWDYDSGTITVGDVDISTIDPEVLLSDYSMVFQDVTLFDDTVMANIRLGKHDATDEEVRAAAAAANCDEFVDKLSQGYDTPIGENGAKLSGGERQRISIARALLKDAPIVLLDEATASLDVENETKVQSALSRLLAGRTVMVIAHRMRTVESADKIVVLDGGTVVEQGTPEELRTKEYGVYKHMLELQTASARWSV